MNFEHLKCVKCVKVKGKIVKNKNSHFLSFYGFHFHPATTAAEVNCQFVQRRRLFEEVEAQTEKSQKKKFRSK